MQQYRSSTVASYLLGAALASAGCVATDAPEAAPETAAAQPIEACVTANAGDGFISLPITNITTLGTVDFTITADQTPIDAVVGLSSGAPVNFNSLAAAVRFAPGGAIDVRDGAAYRADVALASGTTAKSFHVVADLTSHTYSVMLGSFTYADELARQYAFRTQQQAVGNLDTLSVIVDSAVGSVTVCSVVARASSGIAYSREGAYSVLPLAGGGAVIADSANARVVDAAGNNVASAATNGQVAVDASGNVYAARLSGGALVLDTYGPSLALTSTTTYATTSTAVQGITAAPSGDILVGLATGAGNTIVRFNGAGATTYDIHGGTLAFDGDEAYVMWSETGRVRVARYSSTGATLWNKSFLGTATLQAITVDPAHRVVFGGELTTSIDFGGGALPLQSNPDHTINGFVVELDSTGAHVFSRKTGGSWVGGLASDGAQVIVSGTLWQQYPYPQLFALTSAGANAALPSHSLALTAGYPNGRGGRVALGPTGRIWWNMTHQWMLTPQFPFLVAIGG